MKKLILIFLFPLVSQSVSAADISCAETKSGLTKLEQIKSESTIRTVGDEYDLFAEQLRKDGFHVTQSEDADIVIRTFRYSRIMPVFRSFLGYTENHDEYLETLAIHVEDRLGQHLATIEGGASKKKQHSLDKLKSRVKTTLQNWYDSWSQYPPCRR